MRFFAYVIISTSLLWGVVMLGFNISDRIARSRRDGLLSLYRECGGDISMMVWVLARSWTL